MVGFVNIVIISVVVVDRFRSVVVARAAHVAVRRKLKCQWLGRARRTQIPSALEDRLDALAGGAAEVHRQAACGLETRLAVLSGEREESQAGAIALLGMGLGAQQMLDHSAGARADRLTPLDQAPRRPLGVRA